MMLNNRLGVFLYLVLRNDWAWSLLSDAEKQTIYAANEYYNNTRPDYANPMLYGGGRNFDSPKHGVDQIFIARDHLLRAFLDKEQPSRVLEIGPGSGFHTRTICEHAAVKHYVAIEINNAFLEWLRPRLTALCQTKPGFSFDLLHGDFRTVALPTSDAVILMSTLHHIPDRLNLVRRLKTCLPIGGSLFTVEPTHYLPRILTLIVRYLRHYHRPEFWRHRPNLSTHSFCTLEECTKIARQSGVVSVESSCYFGFPRTFSRFMSWWLRKNQTMELGQIPVVCRRNTMLRYFCIEMAAVMRRQ